MKKIFVLPGVLLLLLVPTAHATVIGLFNTGVDNVGGLLGSGVADPHYTLTGPSNTPAVVVNPTTYPAGNGTWLTDASSPASQWIGPIENFDPSGFYPVMGIFNYVLAVTAAGGETVTGRWASDNTACILLGVNSTGNCISSGGLPDFQSWHVFSITGFANGPNTLNFQVTNTGGPTGVRVEFSVPEPTSLMLLASGLAGWGLQRYRPKLTRNS